jgi:hypothetical protein
MMISYLLDDDCRARAPLFIAAEVRAVKETFYAVGGQKTRKQQGQKD